MHSLARCVTESFPVCRKAAVKKRLERAEHHQQAKKAMVMLNEAVDKGLEEKAKYSKAGVIAKVTVHECVHSTLDTSCLIVSCLYQCTICMALACN